MSRRFERATIRCEIGAYVYERQKNGAWAQAAKLVANDGVAVSISGDRLVVGAHLDSNKLVAGGSAYLFDSVASCTDKYTCKCKPGYSGADCGTLKKP